VTPASTTRSKGLTDRINRLSFLIVTNSSHAFAGVSMPLLLALQLHHTHSSRFNSASSFQQVVTCAVIESIQLDPDEGGATRMRGGVPAVSEAITAMNKIQ
jgi:hypothetical protein